MSRLGRCHCNMASCGPAFAVWRYPNGCSVRLCQVCLDAWFDGADEDPDLEPEAWWLLSSSLVLVAG